MFSKSSPSLPPATQVYEPLVKATLAQRLMFWVFPWSLAASTAVCGVWVWWSAGYGLVDSLQAAVLRGVVAWVVCATPAMLLRKVGLTVSRTSAGSPAQVFQSALARSGSRRTLIALMVSATIFGAFYAALEHATDSTRRLSVFVNSKKHPHYINGRYLYLLMSQIAVANVFFLRLVLRDRLVFPWIAPVLTHQPFLQVPILSAIAALPFSGLLFVLGRLGLALLYRVPVLPVLLRPFTAHFLRGSWAIALPIKHVGLLGSCVVVGALTTALWEAVFYLFDSFISMPITAAQGAPDAPVAIAAGVTSPSSELMQALAFRELRTFATAPAPSGAMAAAPASDAAFAGALFADQRFSPPLWTHVVRPALLLLGQDYRRLVRRGKPEPATLPSATAASATPSTPAKPPGKEAPLLRASIFKHAPPSPASVVADALAADSPLARRVPDLFREAGEGAEGVFGKVVEPVRGFMARPAEAIAGPVRGAITEPVKETQEAVREAVADAKGLVAQARSWLQVPEPLTEWWAGERPGRIAAGMLPRRETDAVVVDALAHLVCRSLAEDKFGVVQRDIPKILEAMLSFLGAIEAYQKELNARYTPPTPDMKPEELRESEAMREEIERAGAAFACVTDALKAGVTRIVKTFGNKLSSFRFPPATARRLQEFVDHRPE